MLGTAEATPQTLLDLSVQEGHSSGAGVSPEKGNEASEGVGARILRGLRGKGLFSLEKRKLGGTSSFSAFT